VEIQAGAAGEDLAAAGLELAQVVDRGRALAGDLGPVVEEHHLGGRNVGVSEGVDDALEQDASQLFVAAPHDVVAHRDHHGRAVGHGRQRAGLRCGQVADGLERGGAFTGRSGVLGGRLSPSDAHGPLARAFHNLYGATAGRRQALEILDRDHLVGEHLELLVRLALSGELVQGLGGQDHGLRTGFVPCIDLHDDSPFTAALRRSQTCYGVGMGAPAPTSCQCTHRNIRSCIKRTR